MRKFILPCLFVAACGTQATEEPIVIDTEPVGETNNSTTDPVELTGAELYALHCETCHGPDAAGGATWSGSIRGLEIGTIVRDGRETMAAVALSDPEIDRVQEYLDGFGVDQAALSGREIFANRCSPCHGANGEGTVLALPTQFMHPDFGGWVVRNGRDTRVFAGEMPAYTTDDITDTQLGEIIDFMWAQLWPAGGEGLYTAFCANCHGDDGRSGYAGHGVARRIDSPRMIRSGHGGTGYTLRTSYMPRWSTDQLSDFEVDAIDQYVQGL